MQCSHCNQEHPEGAQFCPVTGKKIIVQKVCPECGKPIDPNWLHCGNCGRTLIVEGNSNQQEAQVVGNSRVPVLTPESSKPWTRSLKVLSVLITAGICGLFIMVVILFYAFWKVKSPGGVVPTANITSVWSPISPTAVIIKATTVSPTQTSTLPVFTSTPAIPDCPGMVIQSEQRTGGIFLLICAKDQRYEVGHLADGVYRVGPNNMFFIYITYYGEVYAARVGDKTLTYIDRIEFFTMILKNDEPKYEITFYGNHPYRLYVKEFFAYQDKTIPIPRYITTPN